MKGHILDDELKEFAEQLEDITEVVYVRGSHDEVECTIQMPNRMWGLPGDIRDAMIAYEVHIKDFSHVRGGEITLYVGR